VTFEAPAAKPAELTSSPPAAKTTVEAINLRNQYIELSKKKALLMKEPQLKREIGSLERDIPELEAWARAEEAVQILRDVIEKHPNTGAAESAKAAIQLIEGQSKDKFRREGSVPSPIDDPQPIFDRPRNDRQFVPKPDKPADFNS
jgi:hypothetical protein